MKLVVGLGNPGRDYERTRHNAGFMLLDLLAKQWQCSAWRNGQEAFVTDAKVADTKVVLLKPITFMNLSGRAVASALSYYKIALPDMLVVSDDIALPCGSIRLRSSGSAGGHNGLSDIERALSSFAVVLGKTGRDYARLRIGVDAPGRVPQKSYVLEPFSPSQTPLLQESLQRAAEAVDCWCRSDIATAMNKYNAPV